MSIGFIHQLLDAILVTTCRRQADTSEDYILGNSRDALILDRTGVL